MLQKFFLLFIIKLIEKMFKNLIKVVSLWKKKLFTNMLKI